MQGVHTVIIKNTIRNGSLQSFIRVPARLIVQAFVQGPVKAYAQIESEAGISRIPLGILDGPVEFQTVTDWIVETDEGEPVFYIATRDKSEPIPRDDVSYTSLDLPRPITEQERLTRMLLDKVSKLERAKHDAPTNLIATGHERAPIAPVSSQEGANEPAPKASDDDAPKATATATGGGAAKAKPLPDPKLAEPTDEG